jgi:hypothetical protein
MTCVKVKLLLKLLTGRSLVLSTSYPRHPYPLGLFKGALELLHLKRTLLKLSTTKPCK